MNQQIEKIKKLRIFALHAIKDLTPAQLNTIPQGHNNNIIWNLGHMAAAQQGVCYVRSGLSPVIDKRIADGYKTGTKPEGEVSEAVIQEIRELLFSSLDRLAEDYEKRLFDQYTSWNNRYEIVISTIDEAIDFLLFHEGYHIGTILALKKHV